MPLSPLPSPAIRWLLNRHSDSFVFGQVQVKRDGDRFCLRSTADRDRPEELLRDLPVSGLRQLAQFDELGEFRPLKSAPDLRTGWVCFALGEEQLELALDQLYPGGVVDAWSSRVDPPPVTQYRDFVGRQTGMYRVAQNLSAADVSEVIRASCGVRQCLKRRRWTVEGVEEDSPDAKSEIACLEPCAVFLECARRAARLAQDEPAAMGLVEQDRAVLEAALQQVLSAPAPGVRAGDLGHPLNPRRIGLLLEKLHRISGAPSSAPSGGAQKHLGTG